MNETPKTSTPDEATNQPAPVALEDISKVAAASVSKPGPIGAFLDKILIDDWRKSLRLISVYFFAAVIASPEIFATLTELAGQQGQQVLPQRFVELIRTIGTLGLIFRLVRQSKKTIDDQNAADAAQP